MKKRKRGYVDHSETFDEFLAKDEHFRKERLLANWERLIENPEFAKRAREDCEAILKLVHTARPQPKEKLFAFGSAEGSATVIEG